MATPKKAATEIILPYRYEPRWYQLPVFKTIDNGIKRAVCVWHRRAGKDKTLLNIVIKQAFTRVGSYFYLFPKYTQARKVIWDGMDRDGMPYLKHIPKELILGKPNSAEMKVKLVNGSIFQLVGSDNFDVIMGTNPIGCVFSEYALQDPRAWDFIRPILAENQGWAIFNYTPRGKNHGWKLYKNAKDNPKWFCELLTVDNTQAIAPEAIQEERDAGMNEDLIQQEFYCSFEAAVPGAYYANELNQARQDKRITAIPYETELLVDTYWDLGIDDSMTIWFAQQHHTQVRLIDYFEDSGHGLEYYADILHAKPYQYRRHVAPHDIKVRELGTGKSRLEAAREFGLRFEVAKRVEKKEDGIDAVRRVFPKLWFDAVKCERGLEALANYHSEYDEEKQVLKIQPVHDWASHGCDALQTLAISYDRRSDIDEDLKRQFG